jgi:ABC-type multidrug transport system ATPase subunit
MADGMAAVRPVIRASGVGRRFGSRQALEDVAFEVMPGELFGVVGGDGAGKSTLLQALCAILDPSSGTVTVEGHDSVRDAAAITSRIGYVAQSYSLYEDLTVAENLAFFAAIRGVRDESVRQAELLAFAGLEPFRERRAKDLSGGMQKKLAVCCSLLHGPTVLVLDEPTLGVDPVSRRDLWRMLERYRAEGNTIVLATSYMDEAARCDRILLLKEGRVVSCLPPAALGADIEAAVVRLLEPGAAPEPPHPALGTSPRDAMPVVQVEDLTKRFGDFVAVDRAAFTIARGEVFGLLGPNGSGKSTTIKMICGIYPPTGGRIAIGGVDVAAQPRAAKRRVGYMSQRFSLYPDLTVSENVEFFGRIYGLGDARLAARRGEVLEQSGLGDAADRLVRSLSGALRQRLALGCALLHEPEVLILDEPTSGVDPAARRRFWSLIGERAGRGTAVLVTTHYLREAEACDRVAFIDRGAIIACDTPAAILEQGGAATLEEAFIAAIEARRR